MFLQGKMKNFNFLSERQDNLIFFINLEKLIFKNII